MAWPAEQALCGPGSRPAGRLPFPPTPCPSLGRRGGVPSSVLAAVVIAAVVSVADVPGTVRPARINPVDCVLSVSAFAAVATLGVLKGIAVAVGLSLLAFVARAWRPHTAELVRVEGRRTQGLPRPGTPPRRPPDPRPGDRPVRRTAVLRQRRAVRRVRAGHGRRRPGARAVGAIAAEPITDVDTTAADGLVRLDEELAARGIRLVFAEMKGPVMDRLRRYGLGARFGTHRLYPTISTAVSAYLAATGTAWTDWTDRQDERRPG